MTIFLVFGLVAIALVLIGRQIFTVRLRYYHAEMCPVCRESRGQFIGVGETSGKAFYRCPHCGHEYSPDAPERPDE